MVHNMSAPHKQGIPELKEIYACSKLGIMDCIQGAKYCYGRRGVECTLHFEFSAVGSKLLQILITTQIVLEGQTPRRPPLLP